MAREKKWQRGEDMSSEEENWYFAAAVLGVFADLKLGPGVA